LLALKGFDSRTYDCVIVVVNRFSKYVRYLSYRKDIDALVLVQLFINRIILNGPRGALESLIINRDTMFILVY
jgi:hypothetical protein